MHRTEARFIIRDHFVQTGLDLLELSEPAEITVLRTRGDKSVSWEKAVEASLQAAVGGGSRADQVHARWAVAMGLLSAGWFSGNGLAVWVAERTYTCRPPARRAIEEAALRARLEKQMLG